jgi:hypothetical protein
MHGPGLGLAQGETPAHLAYVCSCGAMQLKVYLEACDCDDYAAVQGLPLQRVYTAFCCVCAWTLQVARGQAYLSSWLAVFSYPCAITRPLIC